MNLKSIWVCEGSERGYAMRRFTLRESASNRMFQIELTAMSILIIHPFMDRRRNRNQFTIFHWMFPLSNRVWCEVESNISYRKSFQLCELDIYGERIPFELRFVIRFHFVYSCDEAIALQHTKEFGGTLVALSGDRILASPLSIRNDSLTIFRLYQNMNLK